MFSFLIWINLSHTIMIVILQHLTLVDLLYDLINELFELTFTSGVIRHLGILRINSETLALFAAETQYNTVKCVIVIIEWAKFLNVFKHVWLLDKLFIIYTWKWRHLYMIIIAINIYIAVFLEITQSLD